MFLPFRTDFFDQHQAPREIVQLYDHGITAIVLLLWLLDRRRCRHCQVSLHHLQKRLSKSFSDPFSDGTFRFQFGTLKKGRNRGCRCCW